MLGPYRRVAQAAAIGACVFAPGLAHAYEYPLQFTPIGNYEALVVAGYQFVGSTIVGNCSYTRITSGSGRDPRPGYTPVEQTCTWDLYGALLGTVAGAPAIPPPIATKGTQTIYARRSAHLYTGSDSDLTYGGFVFHWGAHYDWQTPNTYMVLPQQPYSFTATLISNGDIPLDVTAVTATTMLTKARVVIDSTTCNGLIAVGSTCAVTVTYDDHKLSSPTGLAYDALTIHLTSNAGVTDDFVQRYTDEVRVPVDDGGN